jgi:hypothetical protein
MREEKIVFPGKPVKNPHQNYRFATKRNRLLAVCRASRLNPKKIADQAIYYPTNCVRSPVIDGFSSGTPRVQGEKPTSATGS